MTGRRIKTWHFTNGLKLRDGTPLEAGYTYEAVGPLIPCENALHGSVRPLDALSYAPGAMVSRCVQYGEVIEHGGDKICSRYREVIWVADATEVLRAFARACALDVVHLWDAPDIVVRYLKTGDESIQASALDAAWAALDAAQASARAAQASAQASALDAAWAALDAAQASALDAAFAAAQDAAQASALDAAFAAAQDAAFAAARDKQNRRLVRVLNSLGRELGNGKHAPLAH